MTIHEPSEKSAEYSFSSLNAEAKLKLMMLLDVREFIAGERGILVERLWREIASIYEYLRKYSLSSEQVAQVQTKIEAWYASKYPLNAINFNMLTMFC